ncbi:KGG domain-containing protein [Chitinophaga sp. SYP-B3965]|uniref:KGG domain-containing protein n=1 Tax=Chitinophaga sp. SYP-B3965 TaxID=2663120 RepID=UPI001C12B7B3|nr:KGG domain-containing protein [Chitinophaga sp. SYP-B3965]
MVTQAKTSGAREMSTPTMRETSRQGQKEFDDDKNHKLEGYDENEFDAEDRRKRNEGEIAEERTPAKTPSRRGFAAMDKEKQKMIASKGGKASHGGGRKPSKNR